MDDLTMATPPAWMGMLGLSLGLLVLLVLSAGRLRQDARRGLLGTCALLAERHDMVYWLDGATLQALVHGEDCVSEESRLGLIVPRWKTLAPRDAGGRWRRFLEDLRRAGLRWQCDGDGAPGCARVDHAGALWRALTAGHVRFDLYHPDGMMTATTDDGVPSPSKGPHGDGPVPSWMIGQPRLRFWEQGGCFVRVPEREHLVLAVRYTRVDRPFYDTMGCSPPEPLGLLSSSSSGEMM